MFMKTPDLIQSRMFHKVKLTLEPDGIAVDERNLSRSSKTHVYFESIPPKPREVTVSSRRITFAAIIVTILAVICLPLAFTKGAKNGWEAPAFWIVIAAILWTGFFSSRKSWIKFVQNNSGLNLYKNKPSKEAVNEFIKKMFQFRNAYLLKKYGRFLDEEDFEDKMARLKYLRAQEVLSEEEFESKREEITKGGKSTGSLGFAPQ
jgi:hypothetical protein